MLNKGKINYVTCRLFHMTGFRVQLPLLTLGFLCCFPGERIRAHKAEEPTLGESTACTKNTKNVQGLFCSSARLSLGAAALPCPCPCLSALHPQREPGPFRLAGIWFNFTVLPAPWPPPPRTGAHVGCTPRGLLTSHSCRTGPVHCCPTPPTPLFWNISGKRELKIAFTPTAHKIKPRCQLWRHRNEDCVCAQGTSC